MVWLGLLISLMLVALGIGYRWIEQKNQQPSEKLSYYVRRSTLYNKAERRFLGYLVKAVGEQYFIMGKVRVADLIAIEPGLSEQQRQEAYQAICHERVDFILTDKMTTRLVAAIELYQNTPNDARVIKRAQHLDRIFKLAGLPLVRFQENDIYRISDIRHAVGVATGLAMSKSGFILGSQKMTPIDNNARNKNTASASIIDFSMADEAESVS